MQCSTDGCGAVGRRRGMCDRHYMRWWRESGEKRPRLPRAELFWTKVDKADGCWLWRGSIGKNGYGYFCRGPKRLAHRYAYELLVGIIPYGLTLDHLCRNTGCVNPGHLEAVTIRENTLRGEGPSAVNAKKTHCPRGHEYNSENTYLYRGHRHCKRCWQERAAA